MQNNSENFEILMAVTFYSVPFLEHMSLFERNLNLFTSQTRDIYTNSAEPAINQTV